MARRRPGNRRPVGSRPLLAAFTAVVAAVVAVSAAGLIYARFSDSGGPPPVVARPTPTPERPREDSRPTPTPDGSITCDEGWKVHEQEDLALCYPGDWSVAPTSTGFKLLNPKAQSVAHPEPGTGTAVVDVARVPADAVSPCEGATSATVDGQPARRCALEGDEALDIAGVAMAVTYLVEPADGWSYVISAFLQDPGEQDNAGAFEAIVKSVHFKP